jgi:hypothetical protein
MGYVDILERINHILHEAQNHSAQNSAAESLTEHTIGKFWSASPCKEKRKKEQQQQQQQQQHGIDSRLIEKSSLQNSCNHFLSSY